MTGQPQHAPVAPLFVLGLALAGFACPTGAGGGEPAEREAPALDVAARARVLRYAFDDPSRRERGEMGGLTLQARLALPGSWFTDLSGTAARGDVDFGLRAEDGQPAWNSTARNRVLEGRVVAIRRFALGGGHPTAALSPYVGLGVRDLDNDIRGDRGYLKERRYVFVPAGVALDLRLAPRWTLTFDATVFYLLGGSEKAGLSRFNEDLEDASTRLGAGDGRGWEAAGTLAWHPRDGWGLLLRTFTVSWDVDASSSTTLRAGGEVVGRSRDPAHDIREVGVEAGLLLRFR